MQITTLAREGAQMARIVSLHDGDVYKRLVPKQYGGKGHDLVYGLVTGVMSNGDTVAVTATEVKVESYGSVVVTNQVFEGDEDLLIFAASREELEVQRDVVLTSLTQSSEAARDAVRKAEHRENLARDLFVALEQRGRVDTVRTMPPAIVHDDADDEG